MGEAARPWQHWLPPGVAWDAPITVGTVPALLDEAVARWGERPALRYRGQTVSYTRLGEMAGRLAQGLRNIGIGAGDRVALLLPNTPWHPVAFFAILRLGAQVVHLSPLDPPRVCAAKLADSGARTLVTVNLPGLLQGGQALLQAGAVARLLVGDDAFWSALPGLPEIPATAEITPLTALLAEPAAAWPAVSPADVAVLQFTGGTTGEPRAAMLTHGNLTAAVGSYELIAEPFEREPGTSVIGVLPLFHIYALTLVLLMSIRIGREILLHPRFDVAEVLRDISELRARTMYGVPTMYIALANDPAAASCDFSSLLAAHSGGAPMPPEVAVRVSRIIGRTLRGGWGMTETSPAGSRIPPDAPSSPGLIGAPLPGIDMRIVSLDNPSVVLPPGERGEIAIRGKNVFSGYWNRPEENATAFRDGYFLTGDIGTMSPDGLFSIVDRKKHMIISGGFNVYPTMIEHAIYEHPSVREVIVCGMPDEYRGQAAKAFLTLREGAAPFGIEELRAFLADKLGKHEIPAAMEIRSELPRSPVGKLLRSELEREIAAATSEA